VRFAVVLVGLGAVAMATRVAIPKPPGPPDPAPKPAVRPHQQPAGKPGLLSQMSRLKRMQALKNLKNQKNLKSHPMGRPAEQFDPKAIQISPEFFRSYSPGSKGQQETDAKIAEFNKRQKEKAAMSNPAQPQPRSAPSAPAAPPTAQ
jgi:hypothetical protein